MKIKIHITREALKEKGKKRYTKTINNAEPQTRATDTVLELLKHLKNI